MRSKPWPASRANINVEVRATNHGLLKLKSGCTHCPALRQRAASDEQQDSSSRQLHWANTAPFARSSVRGPVLFESQKCGHQCSHASKLLKGSVAERQGFEPWIPCGIHAFQACALSHSAISPVSYRPF